MHAPILRWSTIRHTLTTVLLILAITTPAATAQDYGETSFENSGAEEAQKPFLNGLLMLHSFEYPEAREAFQKAQEVDSDFVMAIWGEAMTHNHPIWMEQDREAALDALAKLGETPDEQLAAASTERERHYLRTLHVLYGAGTDEPASKETRDDEYAEAMAGLATSFPDDLDAQAFHALSILGTAHEGRDFSTYMRSAAIAEEVFDANPKHPGAAHYLIHAYDDPVHAPLGLRPARIYAEIAPKASHALHMPSHIFFALGMWDRGAASNVDSYEAERSQANENGDPLGGGGYHALHWLAYARAQQGRYDDAREVTDRGIKHARESDGHATGYERYILSAYPASYIVETERWSEMDDFAIDTTGLSPRLKVSALTVQGMAALNTGDRPGAEKKLADAKASVEGKKGRLQIPVLQLEGLLQLDAGDSESAVATLTQATDLEDEMPLQFGPAWPLKPAHELFGEVLLQLDRPAEAQQQFDASLDRYPARALSLLGKARAAARAGNTETAREAEAHLRSIWDDADPAVREHLDGIATTAASE
ncbi:hypothetical protein CRI94_06950 [Longibacter salinarum]|uniref:Tetratricopeptide repeat protein n=1 Tax=Longibacter salinarum TaxID=1850348 RepID=A0A2A8CYU0_9BACT|nr:tetratricopeptide repeat protein [Longibacter salinarum]PEN13800.1 hypothetical protein CRI94_06950 [Longibacter salinarum]